MPTVPSRCSRRRIYTDRNRRSRDFTFGHARAHFAAVEVIHHEDWPMRNITSYMAMSMLSPLPFHALYAVLPAPPWWQSGQKRIGGIREGRHWLVNITVLNQEPLKAWAIVL